MIATATEARRRLQLSDLTRLSTVGLRTRRLRAGLSALGIAIGVAAIVAVLGLSASSQAGLLAEISQLGTNLLTATNGQSFGGGTAELPTTAPGMIGRISGVQQVQSTGAINGANAFRTPYVPSVDTNGLTVQAASLGLPSVVATSVAQGHYLNPATAQEPVVVLGAVTAQLLGIDRIYPDERIWVGGQWFYIAGILKPAVLASAIDTSVLIGYPQPRSTWASTATPPRSTSAPKPIMSTPSTASWPPRPTRRTPAGSASANPPTRLSPKPTPRAR
jgi:putative ABC transport system permease protein